MSPDPEVPESTPRPPRTWLVASVSGLAGVLVGVVVSLMVSTAILEGEPATVTAPVIAPGEVEPDRVTAVAAAALPSVVTVDVSGIDLARGNGSGAVVGEGLVVTNGHVVAGATSIEVTFADGETGSATLVGVDEDTDLALLAADTGGRPALPYAPEDGFMVGQLAVVLGAPFGLDATVTAGVISALDRPIDLIGPGGSRVRFPSAIQTDAEINPGNSGGPLVDAQGRLLGITSAIIGADTPANAGVGFAIPAPVVARVVAQLAEEGEVRRPRLGLSGHTVPAEGDRPAGTVVDSVQPGSPAARAGLDVGDVITTVDGEAVASVDRLIAAVREAGVGATIEVEYHADGRRRITTVTLDAAD